MIFQVPGLYFDLRLQVDFGENTTCDLNLVFRKDIFYP